MNITLNNCQYNVSAVAKNSLRVSSVLAKECCLDKYNITKVANETSFLDYKVVDNSIEIYSKEGKKLTTITFEINDSGWKVFATLSEKERFYGLGDITRDRLDKRGYQGTVWVADVTSYQPIPFLMSSNGWAIAINTTYEHVVDVGNSDKDTLIVSSKYNAPDVTIFTGADYKELLENYTSFSGRPIMLPKWAMGLTYVCHQDVDVFNLMNEADRFRSEDIPCDVIGLEPGWMEKFYDISTNKKWDEKKFYIPYWCEKSPHTFISALKRIGYRLSLWLCCEYDLFQYEENVVEEKKKLAKEAAFEADIHLQDSIRYIDNITVPGEPWFEHLKKFVDQGAECFKLDGAFQVIEHPDRLWGGSKLDSEIHNIYPVVYAKQMYNGYADHTGKRPMVYSAGGYTGVQKYVATWAGDTGGGFEPLVSLLNLGLCGHSNTSCDLDIFSIESVHFGFLQPWSQLNNWCYWRQPWYLEEENKQIFTEYDKLRYSLTPYMYTQSYTAHKTGMPILRALPLMYPNDDNVYERLTEYMLGDNLLVGSFLNKGEKTVNGKTTNFYLPEGEWFDYFTNEKYVGGCEIQYTPPKGKGGALFVKSGSIIPMVEPRKYIGDKPFTEYTLVSYGENAKGFMYTDDGITLDYLNGEGEITNFEVINGELKVTTSGNYKGKPEQVKYNLKVVK